MNILIKYALSWIGLVALAIINGVIREKWYGQFMNELSAHQLSTVIGIALFGFFIWILTGVWRIESARQAYLIGAASASVPLPCYIPGDRAPHACFKIRT